MISKQNLYALVQNIMNMQDPETYGMSRKVSKERAKEVTDAVIAALSILIRDNERVSINKLGTFKHKKCKEKGVVIPNTTNYIIVPAYEKIVYRPADNFAEGLENISEASFTDEDGE